MHGLEALTKDGNWITLNIPKGGLMIIVGDALDVGSLPFSSLFWKKLIVFLHFNFLIHIDPRKMAEQAIKVNT